MNQSILPFLCVAVLSYGIKLLLIPSYKSTDFEVHRNWLAITYSLPVQQWYVDSTSEWTLDYPPLFAYFEWILAQFGQFVDKDMLTVTNLGYESWETVLFQRSTVMITDLVLVTAVWHKVRKTTTHKKEVLGIACLVLCNAGLIMVDHIHFQYNGVLLGILLWSILMIEEGQFLLGGFLYAVLINMKHLFIFAAPLYFVYILRVYVMNKSFPQSLQNLVKMGAVVLGVCAISLGPFLMMGQGMQLFRRLFPFGRGLCHAYWAANAWSLYSFADKVLGIIFNAGNQSAAMTGGLVQEAQFYILPQVTPSISLCLVILAQMPMLFSAWNNSCITSNNPQKLKKGKTFCFGRGVAYCFLCSFMFGFHVHEKAALVVTIPLALYAFQNSREFLLLSTVSNYALLPLLFRDDEYYNKISLFVTYQILVYLILQEQLRASLLEYIYMFALFALEMFIVVFHPLFLGDQLPFLPLMLISIYCGLGISYVWVQACQQYLLQYNYKHKKNL